MPAATTRCSTCSAGRCCSVPLTSDFGTLWVAVELTTIVSVLLVALDRTDAALEAAWKYVLIASVGLGIALLGVVVLYAAGTHALGGAYLPALRALPRDAHGAADRAGRVRLPARGRRLRDQGRLRAAAYLASRRPQRGAEPGLGAALGRAAGERLLRDPALLPGDRRRGRRRVPRHVLLVFGTVSLVVAALFVLRQENYKRLLAYSTIEHMGVIAARDRLRHAARGRGRALPRAQPRGAKGLAFFGSGSLLRRYDTKEIDGVRGAGRGAAPGAGRCSWPPRSPSAACRSPGSSAASSRSSAAASRGRSTSGSTLLIVLVNVAFFGVVWHARPNGARRRPTGRDAARGETSALDGRRRWRLPRRRRRARPPRAPGTSPRCSSTRRRLWRRRR